MIVASLRLGWTLQVRHDGLPWLVHGTQRAPLFSVSEQPLTCRLLLERVDRWLATAEGHYGPDDPILLAVRWAQARLGEYLACWEASARAVAARRAFVGYRRARPRAVNDSHGDTLRDEQRNEDFRKED